MGVANKQVINCVNFNGDNCACGYYRMHFPAMTLKTLLNGPYRFRFLETEMPVLDQKYYQSIGIIRCIRIQRWFTKEHLAIIQHFLKPLCDQLGIWLVYEIDDVLVYDEIPKYNMAKEAFNPERVGDSPKQIFNLCDLLTVTTEELKNLYVEYYGVDPNRVVVIPNYLPRWWIGESYNLQNSLRQWDQTHSHPRIAFACSTNHFDVNNANEGVDDFTAIMPWIKKNLNKYNFIFIGGLPKQLEQEAKDRKVAVQAPSDLFNYPRELCLRGINLLVAPLINNKFNQCKSNIKWLEMSALGIPMIGQNICTYNKYTDQVFDTMDDIDNWIEKLFFKNDSRDFVANMLQENRKTVDGVSANDGYWLEKNIKKYYDIYTLPQKPVNISI